MPAVTEASPVKSPSTSIAVEAVATFSAPLKAPKAFNYPIRTLKHLAPKTLALRKLGTGAKGLGLGESDELLQAVVLPRRLFRGTSYLDLKLRRS